MSHPSQHRLPTWFARAILDHPLPIILFILVVSVAAFAQLGRARIGSSLLEVFIENPADYERYLEQARTMGGDSDDLIYLAADEGGELFTPETLNALRAASEELEEWPEITAVASLPDALRTERSRPRSARAIAARRVARRLLTEGNPTEEQLLEMRGEPYWPRSEALQKRVDLQALREEALRDDAIRGLLVSKDGAAWGMIVKLEAGKSLPVVEQIALADRLDAVLKKHGLGKQVVHAAGMIISQGWLFDGMRNSMTVLSCAVLLTVSCTVYFLFRRWAVVALAGVIASVATLWALAFTVAVFGEISVLVAAAPLVIIVISTCDLIHLTSDFTQLSAEGVPREEALDRMICEVGGACILTAISTAIGFLSLATVNSPATRHFAVAAAVGVASALILQMLVPITYARMAPLKKREAEAFQKGAHAAIDWLLASCRGVGRRRPWLVISVCVGIILAVSAAFANARFSADFPRRFPQSHPLRKAVTFFDERFSGTANVELFLRSKPGELFTPEALRDLARLESRLKEIGQARAVHSALDLMRSIDRAIDYGSEDGLPQTQRALDNSLRVHEAHADLAMPDYVNAERTLTRVFVQLSTTDALEVAELGERMKEIARSILPEDVEIEVSGTTPIVGKASRTIIDSQIRGNWICIIAETLVLAIALRSLRVGVVAQLPNLVPLAILAGMIMLFYPTIDSDLVGLPMVALGISIDDTLHFLHRYRIQLASGETREEAMDSTFRYTGRAIVESMLILCVGLLPCAFSSYLAVRMLGTFLVFTLACGMLAELFLLPALIQTGIIGWKGLEAGKK